MRLFNRISVMHFIALVCFAFGIVAAVWTGTMIYEVPLTWGLCGLFAWCADPAVNIPPTKAPPA